MGTQEVIPADDVKSYATSATSNSASESYMPFRYEKIPFKLTDDQGVTITMGSNSLRDGWYTLIYNDDETEFAFKARSRESDEQGHVRMRGRWEIAHLGNTSIGKVDWRDFTRGERRKHIDTIAEALRQFPVLNSETKQFENYSDVHYVEANVFGL